MSGHRQFHIITPNPIVINNNFPKTKIKLQGYRTKGHTSTCDEFL